jgi:TolB protein
MKIKNLGAVLSACLILLTSCVTGPAPEDSISYDSATLQNVSRITDDGLSKHWAVISPDGAKMLYCESDRKVAMPEFSDSLVNNYTLVLLKDSSKAAKTPLVSDLSYSPAWYEDNINFVYVVREGGTYKLVRSNINGGGKTYITRNSIGKTDACPSINDHTILCNTDINGKRQIVSLLDNGTEVTVLGEGWAPNWHPNGSRFVFIRNGGVYEMDLTTNQATQLFADGEMWCDWPSYSKDGNYILFQKETYVSVISQNSSSALSFAKKNEVVRWHLYTIKPDGTNLSQVTNGNVDVYSPSWGIDNTIYFISNAGGNTEIWKARLNLD